MANNIMDYLDWRGDLSFEAAPFCEIDNYIFTQIVSLNFTDIVPETTDSVSIGEAVRLYDERCGRDCDYLGVLGSPHAVPMTRRLPDTVRFGSIRLSGYRNHVDTEQSEQFSVVTVEVPNGRKYVSFRGTDDTIAGWKEDFLLAVEDVIPAQRMAAEYLDWVGENYSGELYVGGHSKGGNLAVFASARCRPEVQKRILAIYNNDGPGFRANMLESPEYHAIEDRVITILPQHSMVGTMLTQDENAIVVHCTDVGPLAHDGFCWEVLGTKFVRCDGLSRSSRAFDEALGEILDSMDIPQRREFVDEFFGSLTSTGAVTLTDLTENHMRQALAATKNLHQAEAVGKFFSGVFSRAFREYMASTGRELREEIREDIIEPVKRLRRRR